MAELGEMNVALETFPAGLDTAPIFKGLPDDRCQTPHWGYVVKGKVGYKFADHEELYEAGDAYYAPPGHTPVFYKGAEIVEFSTTKELHQTIEVVTRNMQSAPAGG